MLDAVIDYLPAPTEVKAIEGILPDGSADTREADDDAPFAALAFKIATDSFVGTLTFFRVYSGVLKTGDQVFNPLGAWCRCTPIIATKSKKYALVTSLQPLA